MRLEAADLEAKRCRGRAGAIPPRRSNTRRALYRRGSGLPASSLTSTRLFPARESDRIDSVDGSGVPAQWLSIIPKWGRKTEPGAESAREPAGEPHGREPQPLQVRLPRRWRWPANAILLSENSAGPPSPRKS